MEKKPATEKMKQAQKQVLVLILEGVSGLPLRDELQKIVEGLLKAGFSEGDARCGLRRSFRQYRRMLSRDFHIRLRAVTKGASQKKLSREERRLEEAKAKIEYEQRNQQRELSDRNLIYVQTRLSEVLRKRQQAGLPIDLPAENEKVH